MSVFYRIKELAKDKGWSIAEVNSRAGLGKNTLYNWKHKEPSAANLEAVASVLDTTTDYLINGETARKPQVIDLDDDDIIFAYKGEQISGADLKVVRRFLSTMEIQA